MGRGLQVRSPIVVVVVVSRRGGPSRAWGGSRSHEATKTGRARTGDAGPGMGDDRKVLEMEPKGTANDRVMRFEQDSQDGMDDGMTGSCLFHRQKSSWIHLPPGLAWESFGGDLGPAMMDVV